MYNICTYVELFVDVQKYSRDSAGDTNIEMRTTAAAKAATTIADVLAVEAIICSKKTEEKLLLKGSECCPVCDKRGAL